MSDLEPQPQRPPARRGENRRAIAGTILGALAAAFALLNLDEVKVNWIVGEGDSPLIIVIAIAFLLGCGVGWLLAARRVRGREKG
jgi:uncharacterized integral membrane protein